MCGGSIGSSCVCGSSCVRIELCMNRAVYSYQYSTRMKFSFDVDDAKWTDCSSILFRGSEEVGSH